jgi:hypothetical protein
MPEIGNTAWVLNDNFIFEGVISGYVEFSNRYALRSRSGLVRHIHADDLLPTPADVRRAIAARVVNLARIAEQFDREHPPTEQRS